jgi:hypothetical protein
MQIYRAITPSVIRVPLSSVTFRPEAISVPEVYAAPAVDSMTPGNCVGFGAVDTVSPADATAPPSDGVIGSRVPRLV